MTVTTFTGIKCTHSELPGERNPWLIEDLPPTSHMSHDGAGNVLETCIEFVYEALVAKHEPTQENPTGVEVLYNSLEDVLKSSFTTQAISTSPDTDPFTTDEMTEYLHTAANKALPTDIEQHEMDAITSRKELLVLVIATVEYVFQYAHHGWERGELPIESSSPLPDEQDFIGTKTPITTLN